MATNRGRPPKAERAQTAAQRKAAQRQRDHMAIWSDEGLAEASTAGLQAAVGHCITGAYITRLALVLAELGRRGGLRVTTRPALMS